METETSQHLLFLDFLHTTDDGLRTSVYCKPTHTDQYIHYNSCHHPQIKQAIITTLTRRVKAFCHPDALNSELDHSRKTFTMLNGYPAQLITATINKTLKNKEPCLKSSPSPIRVTISYFGPISHQISRLIKTKADIDVTFSRGKTIKTYLKANGTGAKGNYKRPLRSGDRNQQSTVSKECTYQVPGTC
ncbi:uncharacterized protein [Haliotis asinina]|uniref:uncharacterized protein n=1 Tax=Haliotis asinina TaxID=109174 RepID=UPI003531FD08